MSKIFKNMVPYWKTVFVILALLLIQAMCDLALPSYTSDIIDVGIQKSGVEHVVPQAVTAEEFETAQLTMTEDESRLWRNLYEKEGEVYKLTESAQKHWDEMDKKLVLPLILNYQMSAMEESAFKSYAASQSGMDKAKIDAMSMEELGRMLGVSLTPFEQQKEDEDGNPYTAICVDVRPVFTAMRDAGRMQEDAILSMRQNLQKTIDTMGSSMVRSMGVAYAVACDTDLLPVESRSEDARYGIDHGNRDCFGQLLCFSRRRGHRQKPSRRRLQAGRWIFQRGDGQILYCLADHQKHQRYSADSDGIGYAAADGRVRADHGHRRCHQSDADRSRDGLDHRAGAARHFRLCHGADVSVHAEV